jgi:hypothetical protein
MPVGVRPDFGVRWRLRSRELSNGRDVHLDTGLLFVHLGGERVLFRLSRRVLRSAGVRDPGMHGCLLRDGDVILSDLLHLRADRRRLPERMRHRRMSRVRGFCLPSRL